MKKTVLGATAMALLSIGAASAQEGARTRIAELEQENAAIRKELSLLRENRALQKQAAALRPAAAPVSPRATPASAAKSDPFAAFAADFPTAYKAPVVAQPRQFTFWGEGGAIWSGGDQILQSYTPSSGSGLFGEFPLAGQASIFDLTPKFGWEAAAGFDYRMANSPWHVSGQFRYGMSGKGSGSGSAVGSIDPAIFGGGGDDIAFINGSDALTMSYRESRWIADIAVGRDMFDAGPDTLQLKGGLRVANFTGTRNSSRFSSSSVGFTEPVEIIDGVEATSFAIATSEASTTRTSFLGAGPVIGVDGSIPLAGSWAFDYLGNAGVLFGTQKSTTSTVTNFAVSPPALAVLTGVAFGSSANTFTSERFATMFSADMQVGFSYWLTQNVKLGVAYRMDALVNVQNQDATAVSNFTPDRFTHGPRIRLTGQF
jgi:hypothetical protein